MMTYTREERLAWIHLTSNWGFGFKGPHCGAPASLDITANPQEVTCPQCRKLAELENVRVDGRESEADHLAHWAA